MSYGLFFCKPSCRYEYVCPTPILGIYVTAQKLDTDTNLWDVKEILVFGTVSEGERCNEIFFEIVLLCRLVSNHLNSTEIVDRTTMTASASGYYRNLNVMKPRLAIDGTTEVIGLVFNAQ